MAAIATEGQLRKPTVDVLGIGNGNWRGKTNKAGGIPGGISGAERQGTFPPLSLSPLPSVSNPHLPP